MNAIDLFVKVSLHKTGNRHGRSRVRSLCAASAGFAQFVYARVLHVSPTTYRVYLQSILQAVDNSAPESHEIYSLIAVDPVQAYSFRCNCPAGHSTARNTAHPKWPCAVSEQKSNPPQREAHSNRYQSPIQPAR